MNIYSPVVYSTRSIPTGHVYLPINYSMMHRQLIKPLKEDEVHSTRQIPNRMPYLQQEDSHLYPSDLPRRVDFSRTSINSDRLPSNITFSASQDNISFCQDRFSRVEKTQQKSISEYDLTVREMHFRKRLDSADRWLDNKMMEIQREDFYHRDYLKQFDQILHSPI